MDLPKRMGLGRIWGNAEIARAFQLSAMPEHRIVREGIKTGRTRVNYNSVAYVLNQELYNGELVRTGSCVKAMSNAKRAYRT